MIIPEVKENKFIAAPEGKNVLVQTRLPVHNASNDKPALRGQSADYSLSSPIISIFLYEPAIVVNCQSRDLGTPPVHDVQ